MLSRAQEARVLGVLSDGLAWNACVSGRPAYCAHRAVAGLTSDPLDRTTHALRPRTRRTPFVGDGDSSHESRSRRHDIW